MNLPTTPDDYAPYLQMLGRANLPYFIEGGQAVNALAEFFLEDEPATSGTWCSSVRQRN